MTARTRPLTLDELPMFATDRQIAEAIVGKERADAWLHDRLPVLAAKPGFPPLDAFHGGRAVWLVARFYRDEYLRMGPSHVGGRPDGEEGEWRRPKRRA